MFVEKSVSIVSALHKQSRSGVARRDLSILNLKSGFKLSKEVCGNHGGKILLKSFTNFSI